MKAQKEGYRVAVVGASSLLGKELINVLEERSFPISRLVTFEADEEEPDLPIVDLSGESETVVEDQDVSEAELDFAFLAARPRETPSFLSAARVLRDAVGEGRRAHCLVIDMAGGGPGEGPSEGASEGPGKGFGQGPSEFPRQVVSIPFLDRRYPTGEPVPGGSPFYVSPHPGVIVISTLLLRLAARFLVKSAVAQIFASVSEIGSRGIEELQKQTVNLLSFQKIPRRIFGAQLAFNLLPRLAGSGSGELGGRQTCLRQQLQQYLGNRVSVPALRVVQASVFYSLGVSLYVEMAEPVAPEAAAAALAGERVHVRRASQDAPSQVEVTGTNDILVDSITGESNQPTGLWLWAVADNLRLAAVNAVEITALSTPRFALEC